MVILCMSNTNVLQILVSTNGSMEWPQINKFNHEYVADHNHIMKTPPNSTRKYKWLTGFDHKFCNSKFDDSALILEEISQM